MKKTLTTVLALAGFASVGVISPATAMASSFYPTNISFDGTTTSTPEHTVAFDGSTQTSFLPIWYIDQALQQGGVTVSWNGVTGLLNLQVPSSVQVDLSNLPAPQSTSSSLMAIAINGTVVSYAPRLSLHDPANGVMTTYAPIYYLETTLNRIGITSGWDGTNWTMTSSASTNTDTSSNSGGSSNTGGTDGNTGTTNNETEQSMSTAMWNLFNATTFDVDQHPTMDQAGVTLDNPTGAVTASQAATWLADWAAKAKGITYGGSYHPYNLEYESSSDPYTWASQNDLFQGTGISSPNTQITVSQASIIISNLQWWLNGYKESNGVYTMHVPFVSHYEEWHDYTTGTGAVTEADYQEGMAEALPVYDQIKVWGTSTLHVQLPSTTNVDLGVSGDDGQYNYGIAEGLGAKTPMHGGVTVSFQNSSSWGTMLYAQVMGLPNTNGNPIGYATTIRNNNGVPNMSDITDFTAGQQ